MDWTILVYLALVVSTSASYKLFIGPTDSQRLAQQIDSASQARRNNLAAYVQEMKSMPSIESMLPEGFNPQNKKKYSWRTPRTEYSPEKGVYTFPRRRKQNSFVSTLDYILRSRVDDVLVPEVYGERFPKVANRVPGHSLIQPTKLMLKSSANYPKNEESALVYGNLANLGVKYGNASRLSYSDFRKHPQGRQQSLQQNILYPEEYGSKQAKNSKFIPGQALIQLSPKTLKSAAHFPEDKNINQVYGSNHNVGIMYGQSRMKNTDFRKHWPVEGTSSFSSLNSEYPTSSNVQRRVGFNEINDMIKSDIARAAKESKKLYGPRKLPYFVRVVLGPADLKTNQLLNYRPLEDFINYAAAGNENVEGESDVSGEFINMEPYRRGFEDALANCSRSSKEEDDATSTSGEKNPGNPYTVWKNKYKQNWLWDHAMSGDHMNVNPWGPQFNTLGPSASELFFGRKWWYFNQDDFKPF